MNLKPIQVFPSNNNFSFTFFSDSASQGNSVISNYTLSDSLLTLDYVLKKGFVDPYVSISVANKQGALINLKHYNRLVLDLQGYNTENIGFDIFIPYLTEPKSYLSFYDNILNIQSKRRVYELNFKDLKVPDYWYVANNISPNKKIKPRLEKVSHFNIGTAYTQHFDVPRQLAIYAIRFERNNSHFILIIVLIQIIIAALLLIIYTIKNNRTKQVFISYKPVAYSPNKTSNNNENNNVDECLNYINNNFSETDISLEKVARELQIHKRNISIAIQKKYDCNFKTYINQLRIHESKRLLVNTDLSIGEIAYKVGFNTQSHFNRVFKSIENINPTDFKNTDN